MRKGNTAISKPSGLEIIMLMYSCCLENPAHIGIALVNNTVGFLNACCQYLLVASIDMPRHPNLNQNLNPNLHNLLMSQELNRGHAFEGSMLYCVETLD